MKGLSEKNKLTLSGENIDQIGEELKAFFEANGENEKSALRMMYAVQEVLLNYRERFGEEKEIEVVKTARLGMVRFTLCVPGESFDPFAASREDELMRGLMSRLQIAPVWVYRGGCNRVVFARQQKKKLGTLEQLCISMASSFLLGQALYMFMPETGEFLAEVILAPVFDMLMGLITALATVLIFVSVMNSICGVGDLSTLSRIGKTMLTGFLKWLTLCGILAAVVLTIFFPPQDNAASGIDLTQIYRLFIDIVPTNLVEPLLTCNTLQLMTFAVIFGISLLSLGENVSGLLKTLEELELLIRHSTMAILNTLPIVVFISLFRIFALGKTSVIISAIRIPLLVLLIDSLWITIMMTRICTTCGTEPKKLLAKMMPTVIQGMVTSSSAAALFQNMETCEKRLGIDKKLVGFGIPLGQVVYMPAVISGMGVVMFCLADVFAIQITPMWVVMETVTAVLVSIALPPIPGAGALGYSIMMNQLGIPLEGLAIALAMEAILDHWETGVDLGMLQLEMLRTAKKLNMLDEKKLHG